MRVMVLVKASKDSEAGAMPDEQLLTDMGAFNEELARAGIMLDAAGLLPSSRGKRVRFNGGGSDVTDGPFPETEELVAGFWIWRVTSMDEAVDWLRRSPFGGGAEIEIRPLAEDEDFGSELTPELKAQQDRVREMTEKNQNM